MTLQQISVFLENRAGQLAEITGILAEHNINLRAINIAETSDYGILRLIADDSKTASQLLLEHGCIVSVTPVAAVDVPDEPGGLNRLLQLLANTHIDIEYMYSIFGGSDHRACMVLRVPDPDGLMQLMKQEGFETDFDTL